jgi:glycosyltransferase involved in cell wall biosynthesis
MTEPALQLSIIIPSFNEEARLPPTLERIYNFLSDRRDQLNHTEIIVVDDGSTDGTAKIAADWMRRFPNMRLVSNGRNRGKGFSVRHGMLEAVGQLTLFTDADLSTPIEEMDKLLDALRTRDVAIGSRALDRSMIETHQAWPRELAGIIFNTFVRILTGLPYLDTQCGFKAFRRERAIICFEQQRSERFGFDPELLYLAKRHGLTCIEVPVRWAHDPRTKVHVVTDSIDMFFELLRIQWNTLLGRYPRGKNG